MNKKHTMILLLALSVALGACGDDDNKDTSQNNTLTDASTADAGTDTSTVEDAGGGEDAGGDEDAGGAGDTGSREDTGGDQDTGGNADTGGDADAGAQTCDDGLAASSFASPLATSVGQMANGIAQDGEWDVYEIDVPPTDGFWTFELVADGEVEVERVASYDSTGAVPGWETEELGSLPDDKTALWRGAYDGTFSHEWFYPWSGDDPEPVFLRVRSANSGECVPYTIEITHDASYTCENNTPGGELPSMADPLPASGSIGTFYSPDTGTDDSDWFSDTIPANTARYYIVRSTMKYRFDLTNQDGIAFSRDFVVIGGPSPLTLGAANTQTSGFDLLVRMEHIHSSSFGCVPYIIEYVDTPYGGN